MQSTQLRAIINDFRLIVRRVTQEERGCEHNREGRRRRCKQRQRRGHRRRNERFHVVHVSRDTRASPIFYY